MFHYKSARGFAVMALALGAVLTAAPAGSAEPVQDKASSWYVLVNRGNTKQVLDDRRSEGKEAITYGRHNGPNQQWDFSSVGTSGFIDVRPRSNAGQCLEGKTVGNKVTLQRCDKEDINQHWSTEYMNNTPWFRLHARSNNNYCLTYRGEGQEVSIENCNENLSQQWRQVTPVQS